MATSRPFNENNNVGVANGINNNPSERELCKYFVHGVCRFGENCFYSHDRQSRASTVCRYYLAGNCSYGQRCFFDHVKPKPAQTQTSSTATTTTSTNNNNNVSSTASTSSTSSDSQSNNSKLVTRMLNKPKLLTSLGSNDAVETKSASTAEKPSTYYEAVTGSKFTQADNIELDLNMFDENYLEYLKRKSEVRTDEANSILCPIFEKSQMCPFDAYCQFVHGDLCDICNMACLNPFDEQQREAHRKECMRLVEKEMEEAFAVQCSAEKACGICMETVWEKEKEVERRFGILESCNHVYCLACIMKWRTSKSYENKIVKACPECRLKSDFVTPSKFWFEDEEKKKKIIDGYKTKLSKTACKYFKQGEGKCPFGNKCFYLHMNRDGTIAQLPEPTKRRRFNRNGDLEPYSSIIRIDFDFSDDDDEDEFDIFEFFRHSLLFDTETESDFSDLFELSDEFFI